MGTGPLPPRQSPEPDVSNCQKHPGNTADSSQGDFKVPGQFEVWPET